MSKMETPKKDELVAVLSALFNDEEARREILSMVMSACVEAYNHGYARANSDSEWEAERLPLDHFDKE